MSKFQCTYEVDDGYAGGSRPKHFSIDESDIEEDMTENELRILFENEMRNDFEQRVSPFQKNEDEFVEWAKERLKEKTD